MSTLSRTCHAIALLVLALIAGETLAQLPSGTWQYQWGDEFGGDTLDSSKWLSGEPGWANSSQSLANPDASLAAVGGGDLTLTAIRDAVGSGYEKTWRGGVISTYPFGSRPIQTPFFTNGSFFEARIKLPSTPGSWPAFWSLDPDGTRPELDIMEYPLNISGGTGYSTNEFHTAYHYNNYANAGAGKVTLNGSVNLSDGNYRVFSASWIGQTLRFYLDGVQVQSFSNPGVNQMDNIYLMLNYAVGGNPDTWIGRPSTSEWPVGWTDETQIDWIRVWKQAGSSTSNWNYSGVSTNVAWDTSGNWTNGAPNLGGVTSTFDTVSAPQQNIDLPGRRTLTVANFDGDTRYRIGNAGDRLVLGFGSNGSIKPTINLAATTTTEHEVLADLEFAGGLDLNNDSPHPLLLTGSVMGGGGSLRVNGPGVVSFDGANSYRADTIVDSGGQGPAIARARGQNAFGIGGTVIIAEAGNSSTGRIELENNSLVSNNIAFRGRNNPSPAIVNNSGANTISGVLNVEFGGSTYMIRSDAGLLNLSGEASQASGVSVTTGTGMGARTITLDGAGDGAIRGAIQNGSGTTLSIHKLGGGAWTLGGDNQYDGDTTVDQGTLIVNGATGLGQTSVASGATLAMRGSVRGSLVTSSGATVRVGGAGLPFEVNHTIIDNFESYDAGDVRDMASPPWTAHGNTTFADIETGSRNQSLSYGWTSGFRGASRELSSSLDANEGDTSTYFFRFASKTSDPDHSFGLGDTATTTGVVFGDYEAQLRLTADASPGTFALDARDGGAFTATLASGLTPFLWYNAWMVVDNASDTYDIYVNTGAGDADMTHKINNAPLSFRNGSTGPLNNLLALAGSADIDNGVRIDDVAFSPGADLTNPLSAIPQITSETLAIDGDFSLASSALLEIDLASEAQDSVVVGGAASLSGVLSVSLERSFVPSPNQQFTVLSASNIVNNLTLGGPDGFRFILDDSTATELILTFVAGLPGDFNNDGVVDTADFTLWRDNLGGTFDLNGNGDESGGSVGIVDLADYELWKSNFGATSPLVPVANNVPEPSAMLLMLAFAAATCGGRIAHPPLP